MVRMENPALANIASLWGKARGAPSSTGQSPLQFKFACSVSYLSLLLKLRQGLFLNAIDLNSLTEKRLSNWAYILLHRLCQRFQFLGPCLVSQRLSCSIVNDPKA